MENAGDTMRTLRDLSGSDESRFVLLAALSEAAQLWRQTGSLRAYQVIVLPSTTTTVRSGDGLKDPSIATHHDRKPKERRLTHA